MLTIDQRKIAGPGTRAPFTDGRSAVRRILVLVHAPGEGRARSKK
jgi:hypothetical protein